MSKRYTIAYIQYIHFSYRLDILLFKRYQSLNSILNNIFYIVWYTKLEFTSFYICSHHNRDFCNKKILYRFATFLIQNEIKLKYTENLGLFKEIFHEWIKNDAFKTLYFHPCFPYKIKKKVFSKWQKFLAKQQRSLLFYFKLWLLQTHFFLLIGYIYA